MSNFKFELDDQQQARYKAWSKHHWEVFHKGFKPRDMSGCAVKFVVMPTGCGFNVSVECVWCAEDSPCRELIMTIDDDDGEFVYQYDENWKRLPAFWEKK